MEVWMSSVPNHRSGGKLFWGGRKSSTMSPPQPTIRLDVNPPVLDAPKATLPQKTAPQGGVERVGGRVPGQLWNSLRSMYHSIWSTTPVTWVNPDLVHHTVPQQLADMPYYPPYVPQGQYLPVQQPMCGDGRLWYPAPEEGQHFMDPLDVWQKPSLYQKCPPKSSLYQKCPPKPFVCQQKSAPVQHIPAPPTNLSQSKCNRPLNPEAKEWVPREMRSKENLLSNPNSTYCPVTTQIILTPICHDFVEICQNEIDAVRNSESKQPDIGDKKEPIITASLYSDEISKSADCETSPVSYAVAAKKVPSSPEPPITPPDDKKKGVDQVLPKIFVKDKKYPKEKAAPKCEKSPVQLPFKTANKMQKKCSKKFLDELKEMAQESSECGSVGSDISFGSPCTGALAMLEKGRCNILQDGLMGKKSRSASESSSCTGRIRTNSESSITSVDSVNIEFVEDNNSEQSSPNKKCDVTNDVLAHILGFSDLASEDTDDEWDDDSDWDEVDTDCVVIDDFETFGLGLCIPVTCKNAIVKNDQPHSAKNPNTIVEEHEESCDEEEDSYEKKLREINAKWNEDINKDVSQKTETRVSFGETKVRPLVTWAFAHQQARRGPWEQYARDSARFARHIADLEPVISRVLQPKHRQEMYQSLYESST